MYLANNLDIRLYNIEDCISFRKTSEQFGGLSNMAPRYMIKLHGIEILTSEALYQACRFPDYPEIQQEIFKQHSPMYAKDISKKYLYLTRSNWEIDRIKIMRWALRMKLVNNWYTFGSLLKSTCPKIIVENSNKDAFWGAKLIDCYFEGANVLGRLLMELREQYLAIETKKFITIKPPQIDNFKLIKRIITPVTVDVSQQLYGLNERIY